MGWNPESQKLEWVKLQKAKIPKDQNFEDIKVWMNRNTESQNHECVEIPKSYSLER